MLLELNRLFHVLGRLTVELPKGSPPAVNVEPLCALPLRNQFRQCSAYAELGTIKLGLILVLVGYVQLGV